MNATFKNWLIKPFLTVSMLLLALFLYSQTALTTELPAFEPLPKPRTAKAPPAALVTPAPAAADATQSFGVHVHAFYDAPLRPRLTEQDWATIAQTGFKIVRFDVLWSQVEKTAGRYDYAAYDALVATLKKYHLCPMIILGQGNPNYEGSNAVSRFTTARQAYARFVVQTAKHYAGQNIVWELINEPNDQGFWPPSLEAQAQGPEAIAREYARLTLPVFKAIKQADPTSLVVGPSSQGVPYEMFLTPAFEAGLLTGLDAIAVHPYLIYAPSPEAPHIEPPEAITDYITRLNALIKAHPPHMYKPVVLGEWGYPQAKAPWGVDAATQAAYTQRQLLLGILHKVPANIIYDWNGPINPNPPRQPGDEATYLRETGFGFVKDGQLQPAAHGVHTLAQALKGYAFSHRITLEHPDDYALLFRPIASSKTDAKAPDKLIVWTRREPHAVTVAGQKYFLEATPKFSLKK